MSAGGRYKKIVVPLDGSGWAKRAVPHAVDIARSNNAELILLHVFKPPAAEYADQLALSGQESQIDQFREQMKQYLIGIRTELRDENVNVRVQWMEGAGVANLICDYVNEEDIDLVVMSTHGRSGIAQLLFGSITDKVIHGVKVPVLLVHPDNQ